MQKFINFITTLRNAVSSKKSCVTLDWSYKNEIVLKLLLKMFFIRKYKVFFFKGLLKKINVYLESNLTNDIKYLNSIDCISLPGRKVFIKCLNLKFKSFPGLNIISSSKGIITSVEALKLNVGGENILNIW